MKSTFIFLLTHGLWGQELLVSTKMVIGEFQDVVMDAFIATAGPIAMESKHSIE